MKIRDLLAGVGSAAALLLAPVVSIDLGGTARALIWNETGDASDVVPQNLGFPGNYTSIHGTLLDTINKGAPDAYVDMADKYRFFFGGGQFRVSGNWTTGNPGAPLVLSIFNDDANHTLIHAGNFGFIINLTKDTYLFTVSSNATDDPGYAVDFVNAPVFGVEQLVAAFEPAMITLFGAGLFGLAAAARRRRNVSGR